MFYKKLIVFICYLFLVNNLCKSQELSISSNTLDLLNLGTINGEFGLSISKKWTLYIQSKLNPFNYSDKFQHKLFSIGTGAKYWFWYSNSGWFLSSQLSYISYNYGGVFTKQSVEGDAVGLTLGGGYSLILTKNINLDLGIGIMGGYTKLTKYSCPKCGDILKNKRQFYASPNNFLLQITYLF